MSIKLRSVFGLILLAILLLPLSGIYFFRIYENELVHQTEAELSAQAVLVSEFFKQSYGKSDSRHALHPYPPTLDLRFDTILPRRPPALTPSTQAEPLVNKIGQQMAHVLQEASLSTLARIQILDHQGILVTGKEELGLSLAHVEEVARAMKGEYVTVLRERISKHPAPAFDSMSRGSSIRIFLAMPITANDKVIGVAYLSRSPRNVMKALYDERGTVALTGFLILLMASLIAWLLSYTIGKPLKILTQYAQGLALAQWSDKKLPSLPIVELETLSHNFEKMAVTIKERSEYLRAFTMHVAHEFKTPLTSIQGTIELLHDHSDEMSNEQKLRFMDIMSQDTNRLKKLVSRLLELSRADILVAKHERTDVVGIIKDLTKRYEVAINLESADVQHWVQIPGDILETISANLFTNSVQHGARNITVKITMTKGVITVDVIDDGEGISRANASKIFTPFFTTKRENGGTGLGLVITESLLKAYDSKLQNLASNEGAHFRLSLMAAS